MRFSLLTKWAQVAVVIVKHKNILNAVCRLREIFSIVRSYFEIHQNSIITISASFFSKWSIIIVWVTLPFKEVILLFVPSNKPCFHFQFTGNSKTQEEINEVKIYFFARIDMWEFSARKYMVPFVDEIEINLTVKSYMDVRHFCSVYDQIRHLLKSRRSITSRLNIVIIRGLGH